MTVRERNLIQALEQAIVRRIGEPRYKLWFEGRTRFHWDDDQLTVGVPNRHFGEWVEKSFGSATAAAAQEVFGRAMQVRFVIDPQLFQAARREQDEARQGRSRDRPGAEKAPPQVHDRQEAEKQPQQGRDLQEAEKQPLPDGRAPAAPRRSRRWRRLSEFVVGPCNRVAHAAAQSVVEEPGEGANPIVLHGPVGTGKTHLLEGIYAGLRRAHPDWRVLYLTSEDFTNRFVQAMRLNKLASFRKQLRECDALLVDDLHFLAFKKATQAEFLHTFDALQADGRQMVLTCDCHPRLADDFTPELTDRLLGGVVWGLTPPDAATRLEILRNKSLTCPRGAGEREGGPLPDEVLRFLAGQLRGNVRELEGALQSIRHYSRVTGRAVDVPLVREALADLLRHAVRVVQLEDIDRAVCGVLRLEQGVLQSKGRAWAVSHPRMVAMFLSRKHTAASYSEIGKHFGGRNHSTAVAAEKKVRQWLADDDELALGQRRIRVRELIERVERDLLR
ncbi:MAG TPA: chromosomal replication initiator protein DnaA [Gemmataceae bacterium]|nr:chromosomal replication initiator protein DnaA [Gemmataceae bacterium]